MQIRSGLAKVTPGDLNRIEFLNMTPADAALLAAGQIFKFQGEAMQWYTLAAIVSASPPVMVDLTSDYAGAGPIDTFLPYLITRDFTPNHDLPELSAGDVDIRDVYTRAMRLIDTMLVSAAGVAAVAPGASGTTIAGAFPSGGYVAVVTPDWLTATRVASKTPTQFAVTFSEGAPVGGGFVNWVVVPGATNETAVADNPPFGLRVAQPTILTAWERQTAARRRAVAIVQ